MNWKRSADKKDYLVLLGDDALVIHYRQRSNDYAVQAVSVAYPGPVDGDYLAITEPVPEAELPPRLVQQFQHDATALSDLLFRLAEEV